MEKFTDPFVLDASEYRRAINPLGDYKKSAVEYIMLISGDTREQCQIAVEQMLGKSGTFELKEPTVEYFERGESRDRERKTTGILRYIGESVQAGEIMAPTYTTYIPPHIQRSILSIDVDAKITARGVAKKAMFKAIATGDKFLEALYNKEQTQRKRSNNSLSGAANSTGTPLANRTSHSSLTSTCRITSGYGNANNEKLLSGNRHYYRHDLVINDIIAIITHTDYTLFKSVMEQHHLHYPSVQEVMKCIRYSTDLYWKSAKWLETIEGLVEKLSDIQRAAYVYTGDLYSVKELNEGFMRDFLDELCSRGESSSVEDALGVIKRANETHVNLAHQICTDAVKGKGKEYHLFSQDQINTVASTILNIQRTVMKYNRFISAVMVSDNAPTCVGMFPESLRRSAITSDTDSTIFTVQDWIFWYAGDEYFSDKAISVQAAMTFLASSSIIHLLARMSANIGVERDKLFRIQMKSEFRFDVFVATQVAKTYFASIGCREGSVLKHNELEIKGVMLKSSTNPADINAQAKSMIERIMDTIRRGEKISIVEYLREVADVERRIQNSVLKGETHYLKSLTINDGGAYSSDPEDSPYQNHTFWQDTFAHSYGGIKPPPYKTSKVSLTLGNATAIKKWLDGIEDKDLAERLRSYFVSKNRTAFNTFYAAEEVLDRWGVPKELTNVVDVRKISSQLCKSFYLILETLGVYLHQKEVRRLASDYF